MWAVLTDNHLVFCTEYTTQQFPRWEWQCFWSLHWRHRNAYYRFWYGFSKSLFKKLQFSLLLLSRETITKTIPKKYQKPNQTKQPPNQPSNARKWKHAKAHLRDGKSQLTVGKHGLAPSRRSRELQDKIHKLLFSAILMAYMNFHSCFFLFALVHSFAKYIQKYHSIPKRTEKCFIQ